MVRRNLEVEKFALTCKVYENRRQTGTYQKRDEELCPQKV